MTRFTKVTEWIAAGNMDSGFYLLEEVDRETEKAIAFKARKCTEYGNLKKSICWMPKSKVQAVDNDFYIHGPAKVFLIPDWLYRAKTNEGFVF